MKYIELKENHIYSTTDMCNFFKVSKENWKKKRNSLLFHLHQFYEYEILYNEEDKRKLDYHIIKKIKDYEPPKGKKAKQNTIYAEQIIKAIQANNLQTAKSVSRTIKNSKEIKALNHKNGTIYEYTRVNMREMFGTEIGSFGTRGTITNKIWCTLDKENNIYIPLNEEQKQYLYDTFVAIKKNNHQINLAICTDYDCGLITKEELEEKINDNSLSCFLEAKVEYKIKYGHYPIKVPIYELSAF